MLSLFVLLRSDSWAVVWLDVTDGWQSLTFARHEDLYSVLHFVICHLRYVDTWLSFQVLFAHTAFEIFERTLYDVTVKLYKAFQRVVSYQVVPEAWCREVATLALQS